MRSAGLKVVATRVTPPAANPEEPRCFCCSGFRFLKKVEIFLHLFEMRWFRGWGLGSGFEIFGIGCGGVGGRGTRRRPQTPRSPAVLDVGVARFIFRLRF